MVVSCGTTGGHTAPPARGDHPPHQSCRCRPLCVYSTSSGLRRNLAGPPLPCLRWWWGVLIVKAACPPAPAWGNEPGLPKGAATRYNAAQQLQRFIVYDEHPKGEGGVLPAAFQDWSSCSGGTGHQTWHKDLPCQRGFCTEACPLLAPSWLSLRAEKNRFFSKLRLSTHFHSFSRDFRRLQRTRLLLGRTFFSGVSGSQEDLTPAFQTRKQ